MACNEDMGFHWCISSGVISKASKTVGGLLWRLIVICTSSNQLDYSFSSKVKVSTVNSYSISGLCIDYF